MTLIGFQQAGLEKFAGPGHWNDPDMLEVGNGGMTTPEYQVHMSLWAMLAAPLLAGNDLSKMTPETKSILMNRDVIAIDQDALGHAATRVWAEGPLEIWTRNLSNGKHAIALFNRGESPMRFDPKSKELATLADKHFKDLWTGKSVTLDPNANLTVNSHAVMLLGEL